MKHKLSFATALALQELAAQGRLGAQEAAYLFGRPTSAGNDNDSDSASSDDEDEGSGTGSSNHTLGACVRVVLSGLLWVLACTYRVVLCSEYTSCHTHAHHQVTVTVASALLVPPRSQLLAMALC